MQCGCGGLTVDRTGYVKCSACGRVERPQWLKPFQSDPVRRGRLEAEFLALRAKFRLERELAQHNDKARRVE